MILHGGWRVVSFTGHGVAILYAKLVALCLKPNFCGSFFRCFYIMFQYVYVQECV